MEEKEVECPKCKGEGCDHCDNTGKHKVEEKKLGIVWKMSIVAGGLSVTKHMTLTICPEETTALIIKLIQCSWNWNVPVFYWFVGKAPELKGNRTVCLALFF